MKEFLLPALFGFAAGILSAWGIGGGTLLLLLMTLFLNVEQTEAQAINLLYFLPTAGVSLLYHKRNGYLNRAVQKKAVPPALLCAAAASLAASALDVSLLRKPFGLFLLWAGIRTFFSGAKDKKNAGNTGTEKQSCSSS